MTRITSVVSVDFQVVHLVVFWGQLAAASDHSVD